MEDEKAQRCLCRTALIYKYSSAPGNEFIRIFPPLTCHHNRRDGASPQNTLRILHHLLFQKGSTEGAPSLQEQTGLPSQNGTCSPHFLAVNQTSYSHPLSNNCLPHLSYTVHYSDKLFAATKPPLKLVCTQCRTRPLSFDPTLRFSVLGPSAVPRHCPSPHRQRHCTGRAHMLHLSS